MPMLVKLTSAVRNQYGMSWIKYQSGSPDENPMNTQMSIRGFHMAFQSG